MHGDGITRHGLGGKQSKGEQTKERGEREAPSAWSNGLTVGKDVERTQSGAGLGIRGLGGAALLGILGPGNTRVRNVEP